MFGYLIELLIDLGLLRADIKHWKKVKREEQIEGRKKNLKKYLFTPGTKVYGSALVIILLISTAILIHQHRVIYPKQAKGEIQQINRALINWKATYGQYPHSITELIGTKPLRKEWMLDRWGNPYVYIATPNRYILLSKGPDGIFKTDDDIELH